MSKYVLLTGATGLVGRYLVRDLLLDGQRVAVVIRPSNKQTIHERLEAILQPWEKELGKPLPRPVCLQGDVTEESLGLDAESQEWVATNCDRLLHNAAILTFHGADRASEPWRTNVDGTKNVLDFCEKSGITEVHYVSTAYVSGRRSGTIYETELLDTQGFRNDYEHSKYVAEKMVRDAKFIKSLTVYRPAVIAGDSRTGYTSTYHGLYMYLQLMAVLNRNTEPDENGIRHTEIRLNMTGDEPRNIVPVDWVSEVICHLFQHPEAHGQTYHLSPSEPLTPRKIVHAGYSFFNSCGVEFCGRTDAVEKDWLNPIERATYENKTMYEEYEDSDPEFDTTNLKRFAGNIPCPVIDEPMLHRFFAYGEEDRWGRRKPPKLDTTTWVGELLQAVVNEHVPESSAPKVDFFGRSGNRSDTVQRIGLDLTGPGGGQWTLKLRGQQVIGLELGVSDDDTVVRMPADDFVNLVAGCGETMARVRNRRSGVRDDEPVEAPLDLVRLIFRPLSSSVSRRLGDVASPSP